MKENLIKRIESEILATPTGDLRNLLADVNIFLHSIPLTTIDEIDKTTIQLLKDIGRLIR